jgi:lysophospholipase L1-like esterase
MTEQNLEVARFIRGAPWDGVEGVAYPRADPADSDRLPIDTWAMAGVPAGVRLELDLDEAAAGLIIDYETTTADLGYRGEGAGTEFSLWTPEREVDSVPAQLGRHTVELATPADSGRVIVYLPEGMKPRVTGLRTRTGTPRVPERSPAWLCYGDSIAEGWSASGPARSWPALAARRHDLDLSNLGYAGAARGEIVSAQHLAALRADVISLSHGTNCWNRTPHSAAQIRADYEAFLEIVRSGHPTTPLVVVSPVIRPDAEATRNPLGATLAEIRETIEAVAADRQRHDPNLTLVSGADLIEEGDLVDGVHPGDTGHQKIAEAVAPLLVRT